MRIVSISTSTSVLAYFTVFILVLVVHSFYIAHQKEFLIVKWLCERWVSDWLIECVWVSEWGREGVRTNYFIFIYWSIFLFFDALRPHSLLVLRPREATTMDRLNSSCRMSIASREKTKDGGSEGIDLQSDMWICARRICSPFEIHQPLSSS